MWPTSLQELSFADDFNQAITHAVASLPEKLIIREKLQSTPRRSGVAGLSGKAIASGQFQPANCLGSFSFMLTKAVVGVRF